MEGEENPLTGDGDQGCEDTVDEFYHGKLSMVHSVTVIWGRRSRRSGDTSTAVSEVMCALKYAREFPDNDR